MRRELPPSIDRILERAAKESRVPTSGEGTPLPSRANRGSLQASLGELLEKAALQSRQDAHSEAMVAVPEDPPSAMRRRPLAFPAAMVAGLIATLLLLLWQSRPSTPMPQRLPTPPMAGSDAAMPPQVIGLVVDTESASSVWQGERLVAAMTPALVPGTDYRVATVGVGGWEQGLLALDTQPRASIVRYDALQSARKAPPEWQVPALQIVAPLTTDAIYFIARADSPLRFIHDIEDSVIDAGPLDGARALTARTVYRAMFGKPPRTDHVPADSEAAALKRLLDDPTEQVVVLVGATPASSLARLPPPQARSLKLLAYDANDPRDREALGSFFPMPVHAASMGGFPATPETTLGVMSFLVTAAPASDPEHRHEPAIASLALALCTLSRKTPVQAGDLRPDLQLSVGWPYARPAREVLSRCRSGVES